MRRNLSFLIFAEEIQFYRIVNADQMLIQSVGWEENSRQITPNHSQYSSGSFHPHLSDLLYLFDHQASRIEIFNFTVFTGSIQLARRSSLRANPVAAGSRAKLVLSPNGIYLAILSRVRVACYGLELLDGGVTAEAGTLDLEQPLTLNAAFTREDELVVLGIGAQYEFRTLRIQNGSL